MTDAKTSETMSPELRKVAERAQRDPNARILSLAHLVDIDALGRAGKRSSPRPYTTRSRRAGERPFASKRVELSAETSRE